VGDGFDFDRLYEFRHRGVDQVARQAVWRPISAHVYQAMGRPRRVLDPAAGRGEFINAVPADERWVVEAVEYDDARYDHEVKVVIGDALDVELPAGHFDGVFVSNLLEHFERQTDVARFLRRMRTALAPGGTIAIVGPNFRYCAKEYFDCADHTLALTHVSVEEHVVAAGFDVLDVVPRFLPYSFRSRLPASERLTSWYLKAPPLWRFLGKQFLVVGRAP